MSVNLTNEISRGQQAREVIENPLYQEALAAIKDGLMNAWNDTLPEEQQRREECWRSLKVLGTLERELSHHMMTGQLATEQRELDAKNP